MGAVEQPGHTQVGGFCNEQFSGVRTEFERNFTERGELGASVCVMREGRAVVDLWGGTATADGERAWMRDTVVTVFSSTKGATALCAHLLADAGELDLDAQVERYWPSFAGDGRSEITVRMLLNQQAGLPGVGRRLTPDDVFDFKRMAKLMESERPLWRPGSRYGYHGITFGWLIGEVVRRVSGQSLGQFFHHYVARPLRLDFWIGLPNSEDHRVAETVMAEAGVISSHIDEEGGDEDPISVAFRNSLGGLSSPGVCDSPAGRRAEIPASNGIANARALAHMYSVLACGGVHDGIEFISEDQIAVMGATESEGSRDAVTLERTRYSSGFAKTPAGGSDPGGLVLSEAAFGWDGLGGSVAFADPDQRFSFGYAMNGHPRRDEAQQARCRALVDATYRSVGFGSRASGTWTMDQRPLGGT